MEFSEAVDFVGCKEDEGLRPNGVLQCNFKGVSILMKSNPFLKKNPFSLLGSSPVCYWRRMEIIERQ